MIINGQIEPNSLFTFTVDHNNSIQRIDQYLSSLFPHYSRSFLQSLINEQYVSRNGTVTIKPSTNIACNDIITIQFPPARVVEKTTIQQETMDVSVLETTKHFMVVYKPPFLLVHP